MSALSMSAEIVEMSMLPPETMAATFLPLNGSFVSAACYITRAREARNLYFSLTQSSA